MAAEIGREPGLPSWSRHVDVTRTGGLSSLADRREAAKRRLSSSVRAAELIACGLRAFDEAMTERALPDPQGYLRASVQAMLALAYELPGYDVTLVAPVGQVAARVRHTVFGPEAEVVDLTEARLPGSVGTHGPGTPLERTAGDSTATIPHPLGPPLEPPLGPPTGALNVAGLEPGSAEGVWRGSW